MHKLTVTFVICMLSSFMAIAQITIKGKVTSAEDGLGLPGVNVMEKENPSNGVSTDIDGNYMLTVANESSIIVFSSIGMQTIELVATKAGDLVMKSDTEMLDEVVVVGFGTQKKENLTGAVASVDEKILEDRPVNNAIQALQGAVAGINYSIGNGGGELNKSASINIRGASSIGNTKTNPLVLIDGMEGDLSVLNPQDIKNISVLKDAASASIYGSRASSGVILVTTKNGQKGTLSVSYTNNFRWSSPLLQPEMLDSERFAYYWNDAAANAGQSAPFSDEIIKKIIQHKNGTLKDATDWNTKEKKWNEYTQSFANVNWYKQFYKDWVPSQEHNVSATGGSDKMSYYFSANWLGQKGLMRYNTDTRDRYSINAKIKAQLHPSITMNYGARFSRIDFSRSSYNQGLFYHNIARRWPTLPVYDPNGNYFYGNEIAHLNSGKFESQNDEFSQQLKFTITPIKGWETNFELNYKTGTNFEHSTQLPIYRYDNEGNRFKTPGETKVSEYASKWNFFNPNIYSSYNFTITDSHKFKILGGFQSELMKDRSLNAWKKRLLSPSIEAIDAADGENGVGGKFNHWATAGFFGRINYDYQGKYLLELNGRYDGSSRYIREKRWNFFPSASVGWNITKENFWQSLGKFGEAINALKIRASYGELGNQSTKNWYPFYQTMPVKSENGNWLINGKKTNTAGAPDLVSAFLSWERVTSWNLGFDMTMLENRLGFVFDIFKRKTYDMIGPAPELPKTLGTGVPKINNTDMETQGFELELTWRDNIGDDFSYGVRATLTDSYSTITKYPNKSKSLTTYYKGKRLGEIYGYKTVGIAKTQAEMDEHLKHNKPIWGSNWGAGDIMYKDLNGDGKVDRGSYTKDDHGDKGIIGNSTPRYNFGIDIDAQWKGFDLRLFLQGTGKRDIDVANSRYFKGANDNIWQNAGFTQHLDYFRPKDTTSPLGANTNSYYPRPLLEKGWKNYATQTHFLQDASYIRLKNLSLGYTLPTNIIQRLGLRKARIYFSGENLVTLTNMTKIFDPETFGGSWGNGKVYPLSKVVSCGVNLTF